MQEHLDEISAMVGPDAHALLVLDQASISPAPLVVPESLTRMGGGRVLIMQAGIRLAAPMARLLVLSTNVLLSGANAVFLWIVSGYWERISTGEFGLKS